MGCDVSDARQPCAVYRKIPNAFRSEWRAKLYADIRSVVETARRRGLRASAAIRLTLAGKTHASRRVKPWTYSQFKSTANAIINNPVISSKLKAKKMRKTTSSGPSTLSEKVRYLWQLYVHYRWRRERNFGMPQLKEGIEEYSNYIDDFANKKLYQCKAVEIGFGARPFRAAALASIGVKVYGIDLEVPLTKADIVTIYKIYRNNGLERAVKSAVRNLLFDGGEIRAFNGEFESDWQRILTEDMKLTIGDAACEETWRMIPAECDFVYSEDVFEHIPRASIEKICGLIASRLSDKALLLIRPNMYSGITGGHFPEWYHEGPRNEPRREPWSHLFAGEHQHSVYLNKMCLVDYMNVFNCFFEVVEVRKTDFGIGHEYLTVGARRKIPSVYTDEDLLTNNVMFIMRNSKKPKLSGLPNQKLHLEPVRNSPIGVSS